MDCDRLRSKWEGIDGWSVYVSIYFLSKFGQYGGSFAAKTLDTFWNEPMNELLQDPKDARFMWHKMCMYPLFK